MSLEHQLQETAAAWLAEEQLPPAQSLALTKLVQRRSQRRRWRQAIGVSTVAAAAVCASLFWPTLVGFASDLPWLGPYIAQRARYDQGAVWAQQSGHLTSVGKSVTNKGYTFRVDSVVADAARTEVYFTVEGPNLHAPVRFPRIDVTYNNQVPAGGGGGSHELANGRLVGNLTLPPLPHALTLVKLNMAEVAGVRGNWAISFLASREQLDKLTRTVQVGQGWKGEGYDLKVNQVLVAPTETVVNVSGLLDARLEIREVALLADGVKVLGHGNEFTAPTTGVQAVHNRYAYDRMPAGTSAVTLSLRYMVRWQPGGPVIDLTQPGVRTNYGTIWFEPLLQQGSNDKATVTLRIPWDDATYRTLVDLRDWVVIDRDGQVHPGNIDWYPDSHTLVITYGGGGSPPVRIEARQHAEPVQEPAMITVPLH